jgi:hypothetical protein
MFEGGAANPISDNGLSEQIRNVGADDLTASWYAKDGHVFYQLKLGASATWVYDLTTSRWHRTSSAALSYSRQHLTANIGDTAYAADSISHQIYRLNPDAMTDATGDYPVEFTGFAEVLEGSALCANAELACEVGSAPLTGQGSAPVIQMRYSDDEGKSWTAFSERSLGAHGQSAVKVRWSGLTDIDSPYGRIFHFRVSDPVGRRFSSLQLNVP